MGVVAETLLFGKQNLTGGAFEVLTPQGNDTNVIRDYEPGSRAYITEIWGIDDDNVAQFSIASPRMNDNTFGLRLVCPHDAAATTAVEEPQLLYPGPGIVPVYNADTLRVRVDGTAADDALLAFTVYYENLAASSVPFQSWAQVKPQITKTFGILVTPTNGNGTYGTPVALNSTDDRLEADKSYALLGCTVDTPTTLISVEGPDTGRYNVGMPGKVDPVVSTDWFPMISEKYGLPLIPIIKALNAGSTLISTADAITGATVNVTLILAQLG